jgi:hypothetical protein
MNREDRRLRLDADELREEVERLSRVDTQAPTTLLVKTVEKDTYPASPGGYYWCEVQKFPAGKPVEGDTATISGTGRHVWCYNIGSTTPPEGTIRVATLQDGRYVINHCC